MDVRLVSWGREVKARAARRQPPPLWLFTDQCRHADLCAVVAALPRGLAGVVFRHDGAPDRHELALRVANICRERRLVMVVAGDWRLAARCHAGLHLRAGRAPRALRGLARVSASAHGAAELVRGSAAGVTIIFVSPVFATSSHPGACGLGSLRWASLARLAPGRVAALGGIDGGNVRRLGRRGIAVGAVTALTGRA